MIELVLSRYTYVVVFVLFALGLYMMIASRNLVKKVIGLNLFQSAIFLFFIGSAFVRGGRAPLVGSDPDLSTTLFASPLPQVIVLTAIVVGVSLTAVGLALIIRIHNEYGTLNEDVLREVRSND